MFHIFLFSMQFVKLQNKSSVCLLTLQKLNQVHFDTTGGIECLFGCWCTYIIGFSVLMSAPAGLRHVKVINKPKAFIPFLTCMLDSCNLCKIGLTVLLPCNVWNKNKKFTHFCFQSSANPCRISLAWISVKQTFFFCFTSALYQKVWEMWFGYLWVSLVEFVGEIEFWYKTGIELFRYCDIMTGYI